MEIVKDLLAALSVILNGLSQGLPALSFGFTSENEGDSSQILAILCKIRPKALYQTPVLW